MDSLIKDYLNPEPFEKYYNCLQNIKETYYQTYNITNKNWVKNDFTQYIEGTVTDVDNETLPGVNVMIKGTNIGTTTDINGYYRLKTPANSVLIFSFIGYTTQTIIVGNRNTIHARLMTESLSLNEVVVTGYSNSLKKEVTASVSTVLEGRVSGVVATKSGTPEHIRGVSSIKQEAKPLYIVDGIPVTDLTLSAEEIATIEVMKNEAAINLYGSKASNGAIIITSKKYNIDKITKSQDSKLPNQTSGISIRSKFSDYAYWQPKLKTDNKGTATFNATFPDDITNWETYVAAIGDKKLSGITKGNIKSFKTISANLSIPRFLIEGDSTYIVGKSLNYLADTVLLTSVFEVNNKIIGKKKAKLIDAFIDSSFISAENTDTLQVKYYFQKDNGDSDGELRTIPVLKKGVVENTGIFVSLNKDTTLELSFERNLGNIKIYARSNMLDIIQEEITHLKKYEYYCNEQTASKLKAYLAEKRIKGQLGEPFKFDSDIKKLIAKLETNQKEEGTWGWWKETNTSIWVTVHAVEALLQAKEAGYSVKYDSQRMVNYLVFELERSGLDDKLRILKLLHQLRAGVDFSKKIKILDSLINQKETEKVKTKTGYKFISRPIHSLLEVIQLIELKQLANQPYSLDTLWKTKQETIFGGHYWGNENYHPYLNNIQTTLLVYQILKKKGGFEKELTAIRQYFLEKRRTGNWQNTYESAKIIETILPDLLGKDKSLRSPKIILKYANGSKTITSFPYEEVLPENNRLEISKSGNMPVYFTVFQTFHNPAPEKKEQDFIIKTNFKGNKSTNNHLKAGESVTLQVDLVVKKDADYVMVEVPIPAGCSYSESNGLVHKNGYETFREEFRHKTSIYCTKLNKGSYTFTINLTPRFNGNYTLNPAKAELMYFPIFYGRNEMRKIRISK